MARHADGCQLQRVFRAAGYLLHGRRVYVQCEQLTALPRHWLSTQVTRHFSEVVLQPISASDESRSSRLNQTLPLVGGSAHPNTAHASTPSSSSSLGPFYGAIAVSYTHLTLPTIYSV